MRSASLDLFKKRSDNIARSIFQIAQIFSLISIRFVVILHGMYLRTVKVRSSSGTVNEYVRVVEAYRDDGKVKQRTVADLGRKDLLLRFSPSSSDCLVAIAAAETRKTKISTSSMLPPGDRSWSFALCSINWDCGQSLTLHWARPKECRSPTVRSY